MSALGHSHGNWWCAAATPCCRKQRVISRSSIVIVIVQADREYSSSAVFSQPQQHFCADAAPGAASPGSPGRAGLQHSASATWLTATSTHSWASVRQLAHPQQPQPQPPKLMQPQLHQPKTPQSGLQPQVELLPSFSQMLAAAAPLPAANVPCHSVSRAVPSG